MCAGRFGLGWAYDAFTIAYHMLMHFHAYVPLILYILIYWFVGAFLLVSLSPFLLISVSYVMTPKRKSVPSYNPLCSGTSTSSSDPTPSSVQFRDKKALKNFSENFSSWGVHSECQVILSDFSDTNLPTVIHNRGKESLCDIPVTCPSVLIQEIWLFSIFN